MFELVLGSCLICIKAQRGLATSQIIAAAADVEQKKEIYVPYNVLPLDAAGASQAIMQLDEVRIRLVCHLGVESVMLM